MSYLAIPEQEWDISRLLSPIPGVLRKKKSSSTVHSIAASSVIEPPIHFHTLRYPDNQLKDIKNKRVREFYKHQNEIIDRFMEVDRVIYELRRCPEVAYGSVISSHNHTKKYPTMTRLNDEEASLETPLLIKQKHTSKISDENNTITNNISSPSWLIHLAINLSFIANIVLFITKTFLAVFSGSMAILASAFESFLDILSNAIIFFTIRVIRQKNLYDYPVGKSRMEPIGIIIFAVVITTSFSQVLVSSVQKLTQGKSEVIDLSPIALVLLATNILIKGILWLWCSTIKGSSSVQALAQDHENDVVFNIASTIFPVIAVWAKIPWLDPLGAIFLSLYIIYEWIIVLLENVRRLTGQAANIDDIKQLTYMAYRFSSKIVAVDTVRAYYIGDRLLVEVDIVLPPDMPLFISHDLGELLQSSLEMLENVERAFVHLDYTSDHEIEHRRVVDQVGFGQ